MISEASADDDTTAVRRFIPRLPRSAVVILTGDGVSAFGQGMSLPFLLIYLHQVRDISLAVAGLVLSMVALVSFIGNPLSGWLVDKLGSRTVLLGSLVCSAAGMATFAGVTHAALAFVAAALLGLGNSVAWPAFDSLLAIVVAVRQRSAAFALRNATFNTGMALGAVTAGLIVDTGRAVTFTLVYLIDAATFLAFIPLLLLIAVPQMNSAEHAHEVGYRAVLKDRLFLSVAGLLALLFTVGYAQYHAAFPGWATRDGGIAANAMGACFAANAAAIVLVQLPMLRALTGRRRTTAISLASIGWALTWLAALIFGHAGSGWLAVGGFILTMAMFGIAETALSPTLPAIVNDLAPDHLRGRYNAVATLGCTTGFFVGPAIAGFALDADAGNTLLVGLTVACLLAALWANRLSRRLPETANQITS